MIKRGVERVFDAKHYRVIFPNRSTVARRFKRIYLAFRLYEFLDAFGYPDPKTKRKQGHAWWNTLWLLYRGITKANGVPARCSLYSIRETFDSYEAGGATGRHARAILRKVTKVVWRAWRKSRSRDREKWTPNNFFKSEFGNKQLLKLALPQARKELTWLGRQLVGR